MSLSIVDIIRRITGAASECSKSVLLHLAVLWLIPVMLVAQPDFKLLQGLGDTRYHKHESPLLQHTYHIFLRLPEDMTADKKYPVVYCLDGGVGYPLLAGFYRYIRLGEEVPDAIIVGIAYGTTDWRNGNNRGHDYTAPSSEREHWGGAADFQRMLKEELIPLVEKNYPADGSRRIIIGQSLGGQFVLYTAQTDPGLFWGHIASNPALHRNLDFFLKTLPEAPKGVKPKLFVSSGSDDNPRFRQPALAWIKHWESQKDRPWQLKTTTLEGHSHFSALPEAFRQGMRWFFKK